MERGLVPNEQLVTEGYHKLNPGMKVHVASAETNEKKQQTTTAK